MLIENDFTVTAPVEFLWDYLLDVERIAPCMPGAELTEIVDDRNWKGKLNMKFGPISMSFAGTVTMQDRDDAGHRVVLAAKGLEAKGRGAATATVTSWLEPGPADLVTVKMQADITLSGAAAQMSRGLIPEVSKKLTQQFADCLQESMAQATTSEVAAAGAPAGDEPSTGVGGSVPASAPAAAEPVGGIRLGLGAIWSIVAGFLKRLFGGGTTST